MIFIQDIENCEIKDEVQRIYNDESERGKMVEGEFVPFKKEVVIGNVKLLKGNDNYYSFVAGEYELRVKIG